MLLQRTKDRLYPDGGIAYIGDDNEAATYHQLDVILLALHYPYARSGSHHPARADGQLLAADAYGGKVAYPSNTLCALAQAILVYCWHRLRALVIIAGITQDARNVELLANMLSATQPEHDFFINSVYATPYWTPQLTQLLQQARKRRSLSEHSLVEDKNIRGASGREANWYYGVFQGRGLRNTFVGGLMTRDSSDSLYVNPVQAAFRGPRIRYLLNDPKGKSMVLDLSGERQYSVCRFIRPPGTNPTAILGARYTP